MKINLQKSITKKHLIYELNLKVVFDKITNLIQWLLLPFCLFLLFDNKNFTFETLTQFFVLVFLTLFSIWSLIGYFFVNKLTYIGEFTEENRLELIKIIKKDFNLVESYSDNNVIVLKNEKDFWKKRLTILVENGEVWMNLKSYGNFDIESPFHSFSNLIKLKRYKKF